VPDTRSPSAATPDAAPEPIATSARDDCPVHLDDRFAQLLSEIDNGRGSIPLIDLAQRYAYVVPDDEALSALSELGAIVEIGAGTGYWAARLRARGVDVLAFDQAPPDGERTNRYHAPTSTWSTVLPGDQTVLATHADRTLFLCWPPLFSSLGDCLTFYTGNTVALIGDGGRRTARISGLNDAFTAVAVLSVRALDPSPGAPPTLSIWQRRVDM
jgi:hypothetical protein